MAAISFGDRNPWVVARWAFEALLDSATPAIAGNPALEHELKMARAHEHLDLARIDAQTAASLARVLTDAAIEVSRNEGANDPLTLSWLEALLELQRRLRPYLGRIPSIEK